MQFVVKVSAGESFGVNVADVRERWYPKKSSQRYAQRQRADLPCQQSPRLLMDGLKDCECYEHRCENQGRRIVTQFHRGECDRTQNQRSWVLLDAVASESIQGEW